MLPFQLDVEEDVLVKFREVKDLSDVYSRITDSDFILLLLNSFKEYTCQTRNHEVKKLGEDVEEDESKKDMFTANLDFTSPNAMMLLDGKDLTNNDVFNQSANQSLNTAPDSTTDTSFNQFLPVFNNDIKQEAVGSPSELFSDCMTTNLPVARSDQPIVFPDIQQTQSQLQNFICHCQLEFPSKEELNNHQAQCHMTVNDTSRTLEVGLRQQFGRSATSMDNNESIHESQTLKVEPNTKASSCLVNGDNKNSNNSNNNVSDNNNNNNKVSTICQDTSNMQPSVDRPFICLHCNKGFKSKALREQHLHLHRPPSYKCKHCGKMYRWPPVFYHHQRSCKKRPPEDMYEGTGGGSGRQHAVANGNFASGLTNNGDSSTSLVNVDPSFLSNKRMRGNDGNLCFSENNNNNGGSGTSSFNNHNVSQFNRTGLSGGTDNMALWRQQSNNEIRSYSSVPNTMNCYPQSAGRVGLYYGNDLAALASTPTQFSQTGVSQSRFGRRQMNHCPCGAALSNQKQISTHLAVCSQLQQIFNDAPVTSFYNVPSSFVSPSQSHAFPLSSTTAYQHLSENQRYNTRRSGNELSELNFPGRRGNSNGLSSGNSGTAIGLNKFNNSANSGGEKNEQPSALALPSSTNKGSMDEFDKFLKGFLENNLQMQMNGDQSNQYDSGGNWRTNNNNNNNNNTNNNNSNNQNDFMKYGNNSNSNYYLAGQIDLSVFNSNNEQGCSSSTLNIPDNLVYSTNQPQHSSSLMFNASTTTTDGGPGAGADTTTSGHLCKLCGKTFSSRVSLKQHTNGKHSEKSQFRCSNCGRQYRWGASYYYHKRTCLNNSVSLPEEPDPVANVPNVVENVNVKENSVPDVNGVTDVESSHRASSGMPSSLEVSPVEDKTDESASGKKNQQVVRMRAVP